MRQFLLRFGIVGRGKTGGEFQQQAFARKFGRELHGVEAVGFLGEFGGRGVLRLIGVGGDLFRIVGNEVFLDPGSARGLHVQFEQLLLGPFDEFAGLFGARLRLLSFARLQ